MFTRDPKAYCAAAFVSRSYGPDGAMQPCCEWNSAEPDDRLDGMDESDLESLRQGMLNGIRGRGCKACHLTEAAGMPSTRMNFNEMYGTPTETVLRHLDFGLGNLCNFKCRICNSKSSSKWAADELALGRKAHHLYRRTVEDLSNLDISNVDMLKFKGGEPLLEQDTMRDVLDLFSKQSGDLSTLTVVINTNGSTAFDPRLLSMLSECKAVQLTVSVDGYGDVNDYQRTGSKWSELMGNMLSMQESLPSSFKLSLYSVWSILNINGVIGFYDWVADALPRYSVFGTVLFHPPVLSIRNIPDAMKALHTKRLSSWTRNDSNHGIFEMRNMIINELAMQGTIPTVLIKRYIDNLDGLRRESFRRIDPLMYGHLSDP